MNESLPYVVGGLITIFGSGGAAWAGVKASLNGQRQMLQDTRDGVVRLEGKVDVGLRDHAERITRLETKVDA